MEILVTRDDVSAGDSEDLQRIFSFEEKPKIETVIETIRSAKFLASISGNQATWVASTEVPLAIITQQSDKIEYVNRYAWDSITSSKVRIHVSYMVQLDPKIVTDVMRRLKLVSK